MTHRFSARFMLWKAKMRAYSVGSDSLGSQELVRQLLRPRYLAKRCLAGMPSGVSICTALRCEKVIDTPFNI